MNIDAQELAERHVAVCNEANPTARRDAIAQLWLLDGVHYVTRGQRPNRLRLSVHRLVTRGRPG